METMVPQNTPQPATNTGSPQHYSQPNLRELRTQSIHRLQIGILGLCIMLLLVGLASVLNNRTRLAASDTPELTVREKAQKESQPATSPLADIGVIPSPNPSPSGSGLSVETTAAPD